jgi:rsbT co-antagonist protein RsbR
MIQLVRSRSMKPNVQVAPFTTTLAQLLREQETEILTQWLAQQADTGLGRTFIAEGAQREQARTLLVALREAVQTGTDMYTAAWTEMRELLADLSRARAQQGSTPTATATFLFALKQPLFEQLRQTYRQDSEGLAAALWTTTTLLDQLGLYTTEIFQQSREETIGRQQQEMLELSTPVVRLWAGVLALPLIGTLDSERTQIVMESLLGKIVETGSSMAIIDITGVPIVDTLVAQHLLKTVAAARLMGADCIISGIRPQIAQTIVHLGVDLTNVTTKATLADAFVVALQRTGQTIVPLSPRAETR